MYVDDTAASTTMTINHEIWPGNSLRSSSVPQTLKHGVYSAFKTISYFQSLVSTNEIHYSHQYNSIDHYWSYCGQAMQPFDPHTHICCKGYVRPLLGPWYLNKCCGTLNYNRQAHWCCDGKLRRYVMTILFFISFRFIS